MSPSQKDDDGQEWFAGDSAGLDADYSFVVRCVTRVPDKYNYGDDGDSEPVAIAQSQEYRDRIVADHRDAKQLREQVTRLQEEVVTQTARGDEFRRIVYNDTDALDRAHERVRGLEEALRDRMPHCYTCDRVATRVGYGANFVYVCDEHQSDVRRSEPLDGVDGEHLALLSPAAATEDSKE